MLADLQVSAQLLVELIQEQRKQAVSGLPLKADNHKLSEVALLLSKAMRSVPPSCSVPRYQQPHPVAEPVDNTNSTEHVDMDVE